MPQVVVAGLVAVAKVGVAVAGAVGATLSVGAASFAIGAATIGAGLAAGNKLLKGMFAVSMPQADSSSSRQATVKTTTAPTKIIYGETLVSGPMVFATTDGASNNNLYYAVALAGHEVASINDVYFDDYNVGTIHSTSGAIEGGVGNLRYGPKPTTGGSTIAWVTKYRGTSTQAVDPSLDSAGGDHWGSNHRGRGIAYIVTKWTINEDSIETWDKYTPSDIKAVVKGKKVYDPRESSHTIDDASTWEWSDNPALCVADYLRDEIYGLGIAHAQIDWDAVETAADGCDVSVSVPGSATEKRFTCNGVLFGTDTHLTNINKILSSMNGSLSYVGGKYIIRAGIYQAPTVTLTEDDLIGAISVKTSAERGARFNTIKGIFIDPAQTYKTVEMPKVQLATAVSRDNGEELEREIALNMTNSTYMAQRIAHKLIQLSEHQTVITFPANLSALQLAAGDRVNVSVSELSWTNKVFRVERWVFSEEGGVNLTLVEDASTTYADPAVSEYSTLSATGVIEDGFRGIPAPLGLTATSGLNNIELNWTNPGESQSFSTIQVFASPNPNWSSAVKIGETNGTQFTHDSSNNEDAISEGDVRYYWVRAVGVSDDEVSDREPNLETSNDIDATLIELYPNRDALSKSIEVSDGHDGKWLRLFSSTSGITDNEFVVWSTDYKSPSSFRVVWNSSTDHLKTTITEVASSLLTSYRAWNDSGTLHVEVKLGTVDANGDTVYVRIGPSNNASSTTSAVMLLDQSTSGFTQIGSDVDLYDGMQGEVWDDRLMRVMAPAIEGIRIGPPGLPRRAINAQGRTTIDSVGWTADNHNPSFDTPASATDRPDGWYSTDTTVAVPAYVDGDQDTMTLSASGQVEIVNTAFAIEPNERIKVQWRLKDSVGSGNTATIYLNEQDSTLAQGKIAISDATLTNAESQIADASRRTSSVHTFSGTGWESGSYTFELLGSSAPDFASVSILLDSTTQVEYLSAEKLTNPHMPKRIAAGVSPDIAATLQGYSYAAQVYSWDGTADTAAFTAHTIDGSGSGGTQTAELYVDHGTAWGLQHWYSASALDFLIKSGGTERFKIAASNGLVTIPGGLTVEGTLTTTGLNFGEEVEVTAAGNASVLLDAKDGSENTKVEIHAKTGKLAYLDLGGEDVTDYAARIIADQAGGTGTTFHAKGGLLLEPGVGAVTLQYNEANKLQTSSGGVNVTGGLQVSNNITFSGVSANAYKGIVPETDQNLMLGTGSGGEPRIYLKGTANGQSDAGDLFLGAGTGGTIILNGPSINCNAALTVGGSSYGTLTWGTIGSGSAFGIRSGSGKDLSIGAGGSWDVLRLSAAGDATVFGDLTVGYSGAGGDVVVKGDLTVGDAHHIKDDGDDNLLIEASAGESMHLDTGAYLYLDHGTSSGHGVYLQTGGTTYGHIRDVVGSLYIECETDNKSIVFRGIDDGDAISMLTLSGSSGGNATFSGTVTSETTTGDATFIAYRNQTTLPNTGDGSNLIGAYLFKNSDASGTEPHYAGIGGFSDEYGRMELQFFTDREDWEADPRVPTLTLDRHKDATFAGNVGVDGELEVTGSWTLDGISGNGFKSYTYGTLLDIANLNSGGWARAHKILTSDDTGSVAFGVHGGGTTLTKAYWAITGDGNSDIGYNDDHGIFMLKNGDVGFGVQSPTEAIDVSGNGKFSGDITFDGGKQIGLERVDGAGATVGPGWMTVANNTSGRRHGEIIVTDADSGDHGFIRIDWMRSYADSNFTVFNTGGHSNRITGCRVLSEDGNNTYGTKILQVYVSVSSTYEVDVYHHHGTDDYSAHTAVTPVIEDTKTGYSLHGEQLEELNTYGFAAEEGIRAGGSLAVGGSAELGGKLTVSTTIDGVGSPAAGTGVLGATAAHGAILTGQGSTNDVTVSNDAGQSALVVPTGTRDVVFSGNVGVASGGAPSLSSTDLVFQVGSSSYDNPTIQIRSSTTGTGQLWFGDNSGTDVGRYSGYIEYVQNDRDMRFGTANTTALTIDDSQRLLVGHAASQSFVWSSVTPQLQIEGTSAATASLSITRNDNGASPPYLVLAKSRGSSVNSNTTVVDDDQTGSIMFVAADGTDRLTRTATIASYVDGTPGSNDMPGRLVFSTTQDGNAAPTAALILDSSQKATFYGTLDVNGGGNSNFYALQLERSGSGTAVDIWGSSNKLILGTSSSTAVLTLTSGDASFSNGVYVNGGSSNSGKADFSVATGGSTGGTIAIAGDEIRVGNTDVNWNAKLSYTGSTYLSAWNNSIAITAYGGTTDREISIWPSDAGTAVRALTIQPDTVTVDRGYLEVGGSIASYGRIEAYGSSGAYIDLTAATSHSTDYDARFIYGSGFTQITSKTGYLDIHPQTGATYIRHSGSVAFETIPEGVTVRDTSGADAMLRLNDSSNSYLGRVYASATNARYELYSYIHGAKFYFRGEDAGGTAHTCFWADPDDETYLYYDGSWKARTQSDGFQINGSLSYNSDRRLKKDITPISGALDAVMSLQGVNYTLIDSDTKHIGFVAQDIQADAPSWLTERVVVEPDRDDETAKRLGAIQDGESVEMLALNYANMVALLTEAVKEQQTQIENLTKRIAELET